MENKKITFLINAAYYAVIVLLLGIVLLCVPLVWPFLGGLLLAYIFVHTSRPLVKIFRLKRKAMTVFIAILFYCMTVLIFWGICTLAVGKAISLANSFPAFYTQRLLPAADELSARLMQAIGQLAPTLAMPVEQLLSIISTASTDLVGGLSGYLLSLVTSWAKALPLFFVGFIFMIISSFYISLDYTNVTQTMLRWLPQHLRRLFWELKEFAAGSLLKVLKAYVILMLLTFAELTVGFWLLGIQGHYKVAAIIALLDILPLLGTGGILIPWATYHLVMKNYPLGAALLLLYAIVAFVRNLLEPKIVGRQLGLHPVATLAAIFLGMRLFGFGGILLAPILALLIKHSLDRHFPAKK